MKYLAVCAAAIGLFALGAVAGQVTNRVPPEVREPSESLVIRWRAEDLNVSSWMNGSGPNRDQFFRHPPYTIDVYADRWALNGANNVQALGNVSIEFRIDGRVVSRMHTEDLLITP